MLIEWLYSYLHTSQPLIEIDWIEEADAAEEVGFSCHGFGMDPFMDGNYEVAFEGLPDGEGQTLVYRGWILLEDEYQALEDELDSRGYRLLTSTYQYMEASRLPNWFPLVEERTPPAIWTWDSDPDEAWEAAHGLWPTPWIVKDHVKSAKEAWLEACFVPEGASRRKFADICAELVDRRGERFEGGIVVRPVEPLVQLGAHWTGPPIFEEYRLIFWEGELLLADRYQDLGREETDFSAFADLGRRIDSPFFVADVARRKEDGGLVLIELNDGGTAGLPPLTHPIEFYSKVWE